jgi:hypothetical protein
MAEEKEAEERFEQERQQRRSVHDKPLFGFLFFRHTSLLFRFPLAFFIIPALLFFFNRFEQERQQRRSVHDIRLNGQFLSQYQTSNSQVGDLA